MCRHCILCGYPLTIIDTALSRARSVEWASALSLRNRATLTHLPFPNTSHSPTRSLQRTILWDFRPFHSNRSILFIFLTYPFHPWNGPIICDTSWSILSYLTRLQAWIIALLSSMRSHLHLHLQLFYFTCTHHYHITNSFTYTSGNVIYSNSCSLPLSLLLCTKMKEKFILFRNSGNSLDIFAISRFNTKARARSSTVSFTVFDEFRIKIIYEGVPLFSGVAKENVCVVCVFEK